MNLKKEIESKGGKVFNLKKHARYIVFLNDAQIRQEEAKGIAKMMGDMKVNGCVALVKGDVESAVKVFELQDE